MKKLFNLSIAIFLSVLVTGCISNPPGVDSPGDAKYAFTISASDINKRLANFSSWGPTDDMRTKPEISAPGVSIIAPRANGTSMGSPVNTYYTNASGTSMATPQVAGAVALLIQASLEQGYSHTPSGIKAALMNSATPMVDASSKPYNEYGQGKGLINVSAAFNLLSSTQLTAVMPSKFNTSNPNASFKIVLINDQPIASISVSSSSTWITVSPASATLIQANNVTIFNVVLNAKSASLEGSVTLSGTGFSYIIPIRVVSRLPSTSNPSMSFINPTPANEATLSQNYALINTTISYSSTAFIDWNRSLIGWWRFNNENSENPLFFRDWSTWGNNGTCSGENCPSFTSSGKFGNALNFDGINDYIDAGSSASFDITDAITIEAWINPEKDQEKCWDGASGNYGVMSKVSAAANSVNYSWDLRYGAPVGGCYLGFDFNGNPEGSRWVTVNQALTPGEWYHIVGTFNGTDINSYLNGNLKDSNNISAIKGYSNKLLIGNDGWSNLFNGKIDEVRIHRRALSPEEIKASYDAGINRLYRNFTDLANGSYNYQAHTQNMAGAVNQTEKRTLITSTRLSLPEAVDNISLTISTGGNANWTGQTATSFFGGDAAQSGVIPDYGMTWMETTISGPGTVSFYWKVSSEAGYDFLEFYLDGTLKNQISGIVAWQSKSYVLTAGSHTLRWKYAKDRGVIAGRDAGWVDKVVFVPT